VVIIVHHPNLGFDHPKLGLKPSPDEGSYGRNGSAFLDGNGPIVGSLVFGHSRGQIQANVTCIYVYDFSVGRVRKELELSSFKAKLFLKVRMMVLS